MNSSVSLAITGSRSTSASRLQYAIYDACEPNEEKLIPCAAIPNSGIRRDAGPRCQPACFCAEIDFRTALP